MTDPLRAKIEQLKIMKESASRRSSLYSDIGSLDDRKTSKFIAFDEAPVAISGVKMKYPPMAKAAGIEGKVVVEFFIDKNGVVTEVEIVSGTGTVLDQAAVEAVKNSTWKPARQRTKKVGVWKKVPIKFSLD